MFCLAILTRDVLVEAVTIGEFTATLLILEGICTVLCEIMETLASVPTSYAALLSVASVLNAPDGAV